MHALSSIPRGYPHMARASRTELDERRSWLPEPSEPRSVLKRLATRSIVLLLLGSACSPTPTPRSASSAPSASARTKPTATAPTEAPTATAHAPEQKTGAEPQAPSEEGDSSEMSSGHTVPRSADFKSPTLWYCMYWAHLRQSSSDCFSTLKQCWQARREVEGVMLRPCMSQKKSAWCTEVQFPSGSEASRVRCFGAEGFCEDYRSYVTGNGLDTSECTEVRTQ